MPETKHQTSGVELFLVGTSCIFVLFGYFLTSTSNEGIVSEEWFIPGIVTGFIGSFMAMGLVLCALLKSVFSDRTSESVNQTSDAEYSNDTENDYDHPCDSGIETESLIKEKEDAETPEENNIEEKFFCPKCSIKECDNTKKHNLLRNLTEVESILEETTKRLEEISIMSENLKEKIHQASVQLFLVGTSYIFVLFGYFLTLTSTSNEGIVSEEWFSPGKVTGFIGSFMAMGLVLCALRKSVFSDRTSESVNQTSDAEYSNDTENDYDHPCNSGIETESLIKDKEDAETPEENNIEEKFFCPKCSIKECDNTKKHNLLRNLTEVESILEETTKRLQEICD